MILDASASPGARRPRLDACAMTTMAASTTGFVSTPQVLARLGSFVLRFFAESLPIAVELLERLDDVRESEPRDRTAKGCRA